MLITDRSTRCVSRTRLTAIMLAGVLAASGCSTTTGLSSHGTDPFATGATELAALGVDNHGNFIGAAWPTIPESNQVSKDGDQSARMLELGRENFHGDNFGSAERYFRKAVETRPDNVSAWAGLAASYDQLGRFDLADRAYDQLGKLTGDDPRILNNRGYSYLLRGDYKKAETFLKRAHEKDPLLVETEGNLELLARVRSS